MQGGHILIPMSSAISAIAADAEVCLKWDGMVGPTGSGPQLVTIGCRVEMAAGWRTLTWLLTAANEGTGGGAIGKVPPAEALAPMKVFPKPWG